MGYNFLLVDDSDIVRKVIKKTLGMTEIAVDVLHEASNGAEALEILKHNWVDLVFLDINMPVMNGMQFMEEVRRNEMFRDLVVVVVSTEGSAERKNALKDLGVKCYLRKPVTPEALTDAVQTVLAQRKLT